MMFLKKMNKCKLGEFECGSTLIGDTCAFGEKCRPSYQNQYGGYICNFKKAQELTLINELEKLTGKQVLLIPNKTKLSEMRKK